MAKSMAASLTTAVRRGYDAARRCDGYGSHACCDPRAHTAPALWALYDRAVRYSAGVGGLEFLTGGAPTVDIIEYPDGTMAFNPTLDGARTDWPTPSARPWTGSTPAASQDGTPLRTLMKRPPENGVFARLRPRYCRR